MTPDTTDVAKRHSRTGLYLPFILVAIVVAVWSGWWFYLAQQVQQRLDLQAASLRQAGWTVAYTHGGIGGWPFRTRLEADHVSIASPSGHALAAPKLVLQANAWNPDKWMLLAADGVTLTRADKGKVAVRGAAIRASVHGLTQRWPNVAIELAQPVFTPLPGAEAFPISKAGSIQFYLRPHIGPANAPADAPGAGSNSVDVLFRLLDAEGRAGGPVEGMAQNGKLTAQVETVIEKADTLAGPDAAGVFAAWTRAGGRFVRVRGEVSAGESRATLSSDALSAQPDGRIQGQLTLKAAKPLPAIAGLARSGSGINPVGAAGAAAATAVQGGGEGDIDLVLVFRDGRTFLGPFALAPAPKLF